MHVVFVCYYSFSCNSAGHIACLANEIILQGTEATIFVPFDKESAAQHGDVLFNTHTFDELPIWMAAKDRVASETIVIAWTPRENVREFVNRFRSCLPCRYVVHLEDNEKLITELNLGSSYEDLEALPSTELTTRIGAEGRLSHPHYFPPFVHGASALSLLMDTLATFAAPEQPTHVFWPGYHPTFFGQRPINYEGRRHLGIADDELVLAYTGNVHGANRREVLSLYLAVTLLRRTGIKARLVRTGEDYSPVLNENLAEARQHIIELGRLPSQAAVANVTAMADVLVQPGRSDQFNDYRFPSKLPEFFSLCRPILIPAANLGRFVIDGKDCIVLQRGDAFEIAKHVRELSRDPIRRDNLAKAAGVFAERHFQWRTIASHYVSFLSTIIAQTNTITAA